MRAVRRTAQGVLIHDDQERVERFDHVVIGAHADQALAMFDDPSDLERQILGAIKYSRNLTVLHADRGLMPRRRRAWASWNYIGTGEGLCVTYWMNRLQGLPGQDLFVTLNPPRPPKPGALLRSEIYEHPVFNPAAIQAQKRLWDIQGRGGSGSAEPISAPASMKTACSQGWRSQNNSAACDARGPSSARADASICQRQRRAP